MKLTKEQIKTLSQWEQNFHTAIEADWCRHPGRAGLRTIYDIYTQATGDTRRFNDNCSGCIVSLVRDCGRLYYQEKALLEAEKKVGVKKGKVTAEKKVAVRTTKNNAV